MSGAWSLRHSAEDRPPSKPAPPTYHEAGRLSRTRVDERHQPISDREAERLAEKIVSVASDNMDKKSLERFGEEGQAPDNAAPTEAAREMARADAKRNDGHVFPGSDAALAEAVFAQKDQPGSPLHKVAEKVREKAATAEERAVHPNMFVGPNPDQGAEGDNTKKRHAHGIGKPLTGGLKKERDPDVLKG